MHYEYVEVKTEQNIFLSGFHAKEGHKSCVLFIPGLAGSFMESKFARELAQACLENEIDFLFTHNQGSFQIISFPCLKEDEKLSNIMKGAAYGIIV